MKTKKIKVCDATFASVICKQNDLTDIRCGGPATLGYDFYVNPDENLTELRAFLKDCLKKYNRPLMDISFGVYEDYPVKNLWTREEMEKNIKEREI